jgi:hypothetical protein
MSPEPIHIFLVVILRMTNMTIFSKDGNFVTMSIFVNYVLYI